MCCFRLKKARRETATPCRWFGQRPRARVLRVLTEAGDEVQATADIAGLGSFLYGLEKGPTLLAVRRLDVRPQNVDSPGDQVETLAIRLTVEGLALVRARGDTL